MTKQIDKKNVQRKRGWFSLKGVWENFKKIRWLPLKRSKDGRDGLIQVYSKVIVLILMSSLTFVVIDFMFSLITAAGTGLAG